MKVGELICVQTKNEKYLRNIVVISEDVIIVKDESGRRYRFDPITKQGIDNPQAQLFDMDEYFKAC